MSSQNKNKKRVFPKVYEKFLPTLLLIMAIVVVGVMIFAAIVGLGLV